MKHIARHLTKSIAIKITVTSELRPKRQMKLEVINPVVSILRRPENHVLDLELVFGNLINPLIARAQAGKSISALELGQLKLEIFRRLRS